MVKRVGSTPCKGNKAIIGIGLFLLPVILLGLSFIGSCKRKEPAQPPATPKQGQPIVKKGKTPPPTHQGHGINETIKALFKDEPENFEEYQKIQKTFRSGKYAAGIKKLEKLYEKSPQAPWAETVKFQLVHVKRLSKDFKGALEENSDFLRLYPASKMAPRAMITEGEIYLSMAKNEPSYYEKALGVYSRISSTFPELQVEADYRIGSTYFAMKDHEKAKNVFEKIISEQPKSIFAPKALYSLAVLFLNRGDNEQAQKTYEKLAAEYPKDRLAKKAQAKLKGMALIGKKAPAFQIKEWIGDPPQDGEIFDKELTMISFWGIWCGHCRKNLPKMNQLAETYSSRGVRVLGVSREKGKHDAEKIKQFIQKNPAKFPTAVDDNGKTSNAYSVANVPCLVAVDSQGKVCWYGHPDFLTDETIEALLKK